MKGKEEMASKPEKTRDKPPYVTNLEAAYGAPSEAGFGSAVFYEVLDRTEELEQVALGYYQFFLGEFWERYGQDAWYVWLQRDVEKVVRSYARLDRGEWLHKWWSITPTIRPTEWLWAAKRAVTELTRQCEWAWAQCPEERRVVWQIENVKPEFEKLWHAIDAHGDLPAALASFDTPVNTSDERGD